MKFSVKAMFSLGLMSLLSGFAGCGGGGGDATVKPKFIAAPSTRALVSLENLNDPIERWLTPTASERASRGTAQVAQTTATSITSLQYYLQSIQLCENITPNGTGYSGTSGCIDLYQNAAAQDVDNYNSYTITEASSDDNPDHFIDFMTQEGRAKLEVATAVKSGTYNYALINFMRPIKIKAEFKDAGGTILHRTKSNGTIVDLGNDDGGRQIEAIKPSDTKSGAAEVMTYMLNNGGVWFPMLKPFVITSGDSVILDFAFNPENFATTTEQTSCSTPSTSGPYTFDEGNCVTFDLPYAKMAPVPRKDGETTKKEVYLVTDYSSASGSEADARIELYYNGAESDKAIRGVDTAVIVKSPATSGSTNVIQTYRVSQSGNDVTFYGYNSATGQIDVETLTGLTRRANGTLTIHCNVVGGPCSTTGMTVTKNYTYVGDVTVED